MKRFAYILGAVLVLVLAFWLNVTGNAYALPVSIGAGTVFVGFMSAMRGPLNAAYTPVVLTALTDLAQGEFVAMVDNHMFGFVLEAKLTGEEVTLVTETDAQGVVIASDTGFSKVPGQRAYYDPVGAELIATHASGSWVIGYYVADKATADTTARVMLRQGVLDTPLAP